jgi:very-short-patch-repair endonuclease
MSAPLFLPPLEGEGPEQREGGGVVRSCGVRTRRGKALEPNQPPHPGRRGPTDPPPQGEGWERAPEKLVRNARKLRKSMTRYEVKLWMRLRELNNQGLRFRRQVPLRGYICDFACHATKVIIEVDGMQHGFAPQAKRDAARDAVLGNAGFLTLRFTNDEIWSNIDGVMETVFLKSQARISPLPAAVLPREPHVTRPAP